MNTHTLGAPVDLSAFRVLLSLGAATAAVVLGYGLATVVNIETTAADPDIVVVDPMDGTDRELRQLMHRR